jgi:hypothetical protein
MTPPTGTQIIDSHPHAVVDSTTGVPQVDAGLTVTDAQAAAIGAAIGAAVGTNEATIAADAAPTWQNSSGTTGAATTADGPGGDGTLLAADAAHTFYAYSISNSGSIAGFYSIDGGTTWHYLPANCSMYRHAKIVNKAIKIRRVAGGSNLSGVFVSVWGI